MTEKELKKLSRTDLLAMLLNRTRENERLQTEIAALEEKLSSRMITIDNAGSLAEACLQLNGVFDAAQNAAAQYIGNIQALSERQESICAKMQAEAEEKCKRMETDMIRKCQGMEAATRKRCEERLSQAKQQAAICLNEMSPKMDELQRLHSGLSNSSGEE